MGQAQRTVSHLRLKAPGEAEARRLLPVLEDALRCASFGDDDGRLLVLRRLALGRLPAGISPQALSLLIEQRSAEAARHWVDAAHATAPAADCVAFSGALDARVQLALRLLRGQPCDAWYWPLAVPEFDAQQDSGASLRAIACTLAGWPEARVALPAWLAAAVPAGRALALARAIGPVLGPALLQQAGLAPPPVAATIPSAPAGATLAFAPPPSRSAPHHEPPTAALPAWLQHALRQVLPPGQAPARAVAPTLPVAPAVGDPDAPAVRRSAVQAGVALPPPAAESDATAQAPVPRGEPAPMEWPAARHRVRPQPADPEPPRAQPADTVAFAALAQPAWLTPTACGGLLFLLPVLQQLQWPQWLQTQPPEDAPRHTAALLHLALRRLRAPPDDPLWQLALAPADPGLAAGWLADARRWLHRAGRLGLVTLARRPARVALTATHVDLVFRLDQTDLRLRRLGLDLDPGWVPWMGRVVGYHYGDGV